MIVGIGTDVCTISRMQKIVRRATPLFYQRLLSEHELLHYQQLPDREQQVQWLAGVYAAKEAALKACKVGIDGRYGFHQLSTLSPTSSRPHLTLPPKLVAALGDHICCHLDIRHSPSMAVAFVVIEKVAQIGLGKGETDTDG